MGSFHCHCVKRGRRAKLKIRQSTGDFQMAEKSPALFRVCIKITCQETLRVSGFPDRKIAQVIFFTGPYRRRKTLKKRDVIPVLH